LAANDAMNPPVAFFWPSDGPQMYGHYSIIGEGRTLSLPSWWRCGLIYLAVACLFAALALPGRPTRINR
jgi:hypothetical protein